MARTGVKFPTDERGLTIEVLGLGQNYQVPITSEPQVLGPFEQDSVVIICPDVDCRIAIGVDAKADKTCTRLLANSWLPTKVLATQQISLCWNGEHDGMADITEAT